MTDVPLEPEADFEIDLGTLEPAEETELNLDFGDDDNSDQHDVCDDQRRNQYCAERTNSPLFQREPERYTDRKYRKSDHVLHLVKPEHPLNLGERTPGREQPYHRRNNYRRQFQKYPQDPVFIYLRNSASPSMRELH